MYEIIIIGSFSCLVLTIYWMVKMLSYTKQNRIINSMILKTIIKYCEEKGVKIDIDKIQNEVEENL